jgi:dihydropteroate synthase
VSVDTRKSAVAQRVLESGAAMINDVSALRYDSSVAAAVARAGASLVIMHSRGTPATMAREATYRALIPEICAELRAAASLAEAAGVSDDRIIFDPGIGFAKQAAQSYGVLARLGELAEALDRPLLVGPSRKSFLRDVSGGRPADDRDWATAAAVTAAVLAGAHVVRVHAVAEMVQVVRAAEEIRRNG